MDTPEEEALQKIEACYAEQGQVLDLSFMELRELPPEIGKLQNLSWLYLHKNQLSDLPAAIGQLQNLSRLYLDSNQLSDLPAAIGQLQNLSKLYLDSNELSDLPAAIGQLQNLSALYLSSNELSDLPAAIGQLQNLSKLDLSSNQLSALPAAIGQLQNLSELDLSYNQLSDLPAAIGQLQNLSELDLSKNQLSDLPAAIGQLQNLSKLDLSSNQLSDLPAAIGQLQNLSVLDLSENQLSDLPAAIGQLQNLSVLYLHENQLSDLPAAIGQLQNLSQLDLSENQLSDLPAAIGQLQNLSVLYLDSNQLSDLPAAIGQLQNLETIDLYNNHFGLFPSAIFALQQLSQLDLQHNRLSVLPPEILQLNLQIVWREEESPEVGEISLVNNPWRDPPLEIIKQGNTAIAAYFAAKDKKPLNELKILLVGDGSAGKTSLLRRLIKEKFNPKESQTHGINIKPFVLTARKREVVLNYWDFGGQEVMHHTHQFFLSKRSLYILVLDGRKEEKPEYWLNYTATLGGNSPVLVVLNKADQNPGFEVNRVDLQRKYPNIYGFYRVSCKSRSGMSELRKALQQAMFTVEMLETLWPSSWFAVKQALMTLDKPFISENEYIALCEQHDVAEPDAQDTLVEFLHQLGTVVHFDHIDLREVHVLEPHWVTEAVYRIVTHPRLAEAKGVLTLSELPTLLKAKAGQYDYPRNVHRYIIALMKKFELCYPLNDDQLLIPDLLPVEENAPDFNENDTLRFILTYHFMPRAILPRFIVRRHQDIQNRQQWRTGVVLHDSKTKATALIRGDRENRKIEIMVNGTRKREYFAVIRDTLWDIHRSFEVEKLGIEEHIPLPGYPEQTVTYEELLSLEEWGRTTYTSGRLRQDFAVKELLNGIRTLPREQVYHALTSLLPAQLKQVQFQLRMPKEFIQPNATPAEQALDLIQYAEQRDGLEALMAVIKRVK